MLDLKNDESNLIIKNETKNEYSINEIFNFQINRKRNNLAINTKNCFQY